MKNNKSEISPTQGEVSGKPNDLAHRHGGAEAPIWERDPKLKRAIEETHDAVFGAAPCSAPVFSSKVIGNEYTFERRVEVNDGYSEKTSLTPNQPSNDLPPKHANQTQYPD